MTTTNQVWTVNSAGSDQRFERAHRFALQVPVRLFVTFESWQLSWLLQSFNMSSSGIVCGFHVKDEKTATTALDLQTILGVEPEVRLQIEHHQNHLFAPVVWVRVVRNLRRNWGLEIAMTYTEYSSDLVALLEDISAGANHVTK